MVILSRGENLHHKGAVDNNFVFTDGSVLELLDEVVKEVFMVGLRLLHAPGEVLTNKGKQKEN